MGRIDAWDELSLFGIWDELSLGTNCRLGRIVAWDELSLGTNCRPTKSQDSFQKFQEKPRIGKKMQEDSRFPFRTSVIIRPSEVSANELINYPKIFSVMELRSKNDKLQTQI